MVKQSKNARFVSVRHKLILILSAFLFLTLVTLGGFLTVFYTLTLEDQTRQREELFARNVQQSINQVLFAGKYQAQAYVESLVNREKSLRYVFIVDRASRKAIVHSDPSKVGAVFDDPVTRSAFALKNGDRLTAQTLHLPSGEGIHDLALPYKREYLQESAGIIRIGISASSEEELIRRCRFITFALTFFFLGAGVFLAIALSIRLTTTLNALVSAARLLGEGKYETRLPVSSGKRDEFDFLALAFNQMAERLQVYAEGLEHQVAERTKELGSANQALRESEERIRAQYEKLKELDHLKDDFLSVISHELRTPINAIMGFGSILEDELAGPLNEQQHEHLGKMLSGAENLLVLVSDLLDLTRIQAGRFSITPRSMLLAEVVEDVVANLEPLVEVKRQTLTNEVSHDLPLVMADDQRIGQVLINLINNAIKFTPEGGKIWLRAHVEGEYLCCEVADNGNGIAPEDIPRLFVRFTQLDMTTTRKVGGVGLGLSICKAIVEAQGGTIAVESPGLGKGATFRFTLPLDKA